jgi:hypothetical protein
VAGPKNSVLLSSTSFSSLQSQAPDMSQQAGSFQHIIWASTRYYLTIFVGFAILMLMLVI